MLFFPRCSAYVAKGWVLKPDYNIQKSASARTDTTRTSRMAGEKSFAFPRTIAYGFDAPPFPILKKAKTLNMGLCSVSLFKEVQLTFFKNQAYSAQFKEVAVIDDFLHRSRRPAVNLLIIKDDAHRIVVSK